MGTMRESLKQRRPIPMTRAEAKRFRKMVFGFIHSDIQRMRIAASGQYDDTQLAQIDRIESHAFAAVLESYRGEVR